MSMRQAAHLTGWLVSVAMAAQVSIALAQQAAPPAGGSPSRPQGASAPAKPTERRKPTVTVKNGRLSADVQQGRLEWLLDKVSDAARIAIVWGAGVEGQRVSLQLQDVPIEEALRQILKDHDAFFFYGYGVEKKEPASLKAVWVYPGGRGRGLQPVPPEDWASTKEMEQNLADHDPEVRAKAIEALVERKGAKALDAVLKGLADGDDQVRMRTLYQALSSDVQLPVEALGAAVQDPSPDVRFLALEAVAERPETKAMAESALADPNPLVRQKAREILGIRDPKIPAPVQGQPRPQQP